MVGAGGDRAGRAPRAGRRPRNNNTLTRRVCASPYPQAPGGLSDAKATALAAVLKALLNETRESMPYMHKEPAGALDSVIPVVHVSAHDARRTGCMGRAHGVHGGGRSCYSAPPGF